MQAGGQEFESLYLHWLKKLSQREFFENYTVKENGSFSEIKQKKSRVFCIEICERSSSRETQVSNKKLWNISFADMKHSKEQQSLILKKKLKLLKES